MKDELALINAQGARWGMTLSREAAERLNESRREALSAQGRAELGGGVLPLLAESFCDSPYIQSGEWEETLAELQDIFYAAKTDCEDRLRDDQLVGFMKKTFNGRAGGSLEYLAGTALPLVCRWAREKGLPPDTDAFWEGGSVCEDTARELLEGAAFTLEAAGETRALAPLEPDFRASLEAGVKKLEAECARARGLYARACLTAPQFENLSYRDTLKSIGGFFEKYDARRFPLRIPCDIDYQLCAPVPETLRGVFYVGEYLRRIVIENALLRRFDSALLAVLLDACCPDPRGLLINLYEPVMTNAVGLVLAGGDPLRLMITPPERELLAELFRGLSETPARAALRAAAEKLARALGMDAAEKEYLTGAAEALRPRISAVLDCGGLSGVFLSAKR